VKTMFLAAAAVISLGMGVAFAQSSPSASGYVYPNFWGNQAAQTAPQGHVAPQSSGDAISTYVTQTSQGTWLFPPNPNNGG
jgi:hypothetical protein